MINDRSTFQTKAGTYRIKKLLGKGKSGYAYLAEKEGEQRVLKVMHYEPVAYYTFEENKVKSEVEAYRISQNHPTGVGLLPPSEWLLKPELENSFNMSFRGTK